jgi:hypothetical protein
MVPFKPFVFYILVSKFFENKILRDTLLRNPRWTRIPERSNKKFDLNLALLQSNPISPAFDAKFI